MYNTNFLCTYKLHDDEDIQDTLYRHDYLYALGLKEYDSDAIITLLQNIYDKLKDNKDYIEIAESHYYFSKENQNHELILQFLFSFHTFDLFHKCLVFLLQDDKTNTADQEEFLKTKKILMHEITKK
jgi:hypothetical protein